MLGTPELIEGTRELLLGTQELMFGTRELILGTQELILGTPELILGTQELILGTPDLIGGTRELIGRTPEASVCRSQQYVVANDKTKLVGQWNDSQQRQRNTRRLGNLFPILE